MLVRGSERAGGWAGRLSSLALAQGEWTITFVLSGFQNCSEASLSATAMAFSRMFGFFLNPAHEGRDERELMLT